MKKLIFLFFFLYIFPTFVFADATTHAIGDTGYMIREAMFAHASKYSKNDYNKALMLQKEAKKWMRGTHAKGRSIQNALKLTKEAYGLAKNARDVALRAQNMRVSH